MGIVGTCQRPLCPQPEGAEPSVCWMSLLHLLLAGHGLTPNPVQTFRGLPEAQPLSALLFLMRKVSSSPVPSPWLPRLCCSFKPSPTPILASRARCTHEQAM